MAEVGAHAHPHPHDSRIQPNAKRGVECVVCVDEFTSPVQSGAISVLQPTREQCGECVVFIASARQHNPGCILAIVYVRTYVSVTLRNVKCHAYLLCLGINLLHLGMRTHGSQLSVLPRVPRPVQTDDFSAGKRLHWSENSGAGSEESCSSGHGPRPARAYT